MNKKISIVASSGEEIEIDEAMIIGRGNEADYIINDAQVSRKHASLLPVEDGIFVEDLASSNGTFLNGERRESFTAREGDSVRFYKHEFQVKVALRGIISEPTIVYSPELTVVCPADQIVGTSMVEESPPVQPVQVEEFPLPREESNVVQPWWQPSDTGPEKTRFISDIQLPSTPKMSWIIKNTGRPDQPRLLGMTGSVAGYSFALGEGRFIIGRNPQQCNIVIEDDGVSNRHAQLIHEGGVWKLVDLLSSNRSQVNGKRSQTAYLKDGDVLTLGQVTLLFQLPGSNVHWGDDEETVPGDMEIRMPITTLESSDKGFAIFASVTGFLALIVAGVFMMV